MLVSRYYGMDPFTPPNKNQKEVEEFNDVLGIKPFCYSNILSEGNIFTSSNDKKQT